MSSSRPYTFEFAAKKCAENGSWEPRPNTRIVIGNDPDQEADVLYVYLYGGLIARLFSDGWCEVLADTDMSHTTRNRINDALQPLGWKLRLNPVTNSNYVLQRIHDKTFIDYLPGQIVPQIGA